LNRHLSSLRLSKIGFVFQTFNLLATMSAFENVELPMTVLGKLGKKERQKRAMTLLGMVGLRDRANHLPSELSGMLKTITPSSPVWLGPSEIIRTKL
jgi:putative ABC transport system ATP-binding protein